MREAHVPRGTASARILLELGLRHGLSAEDCLRTTKLRRETIVDPLGEITVAQELRLVQNLAGALGKRPALGLEAGSRYHIDLFGILGFACMSAPRLRDIIDISLRYQDLTFTLARAETVREADRTFVAVDVSHLPAEVRRFVVDQALATIWATISDLSETPPRPRLEMAYETVSDVERYRQVFGVQPVLGQPVHRIGFANGDLEAPRPHADPTALRLCEQGCRELLTRRRRQVGTTGLVRDRLTRAQGTIPTMDVIAADLHVTPRTLRRALLTEGTSFRKLDESARRERAAELLAAGLPIEQIAPQVGYSSSSAFVHAFKRWHGVAPGVARLRAQVADEHVGELVDHALAGDLGRLDDVTDGQLGGDFDHDPHDCLDVQIGPELSTVGDEVHPDQVGHPAVQRVELVGAAELSGALDDGA